MTAVSARIVTIYSDCPQVQPYALQLFSRFQSGLYNNTDYLILGYNLIMSGQERYYARIMTKIQLDAFFKKVGANYFNVRLYDNTGTLVMTVDPYSATPSANYFRLAPYHVYTVAVNYLAGIPGTTEPCVMYAYYSPNVKWFFTTDWLPLTDGFKTGMSSQVVDQWDNLQINFVNVEMIKNERIQLALSGKAIVSGSIQIISSNSSFVTSYTQLFVKDNSIIVIIKAIKSGIFTGTILVKTVGAGPGESVAVPLATAFENLSST